MPEKNQVITAEGYNAAKLLALAYGACEKLGWNIKYAAENILVAYTIRTMNRWDMEMTFQSTDGQLTVNSKMIHGEAFDMMNRNQKNINQFVEAFNDIEQKADETSLQVWNEKINALVQGTIVAAEQEIKEAAEIDKVMNFSTGNLYVTYGIIGIKVLVFLLMMINGVHIMTPTVADIIKWGGNNYDYTTGGDWWRLITCMFEHIGIFHLLLNMYALYVLATYLEPMLGKLRFTAGYFATGIAASLVSLWWNENSGITSAGASGAIFGMYGIMLALLLTKLIPKQVRQGLLQSILIFVAYNIFYGVRPGSGIDNAAHIGGFLSGFVIGYIFYFSLGKNESPQKAKMYSGAVLLIVAIAAYMMVGEGAKSDNAKFNNALLEFGEIEQKALAVYRDTTLSVEKEKEMLRSITIPAWENANAIFKDINEEKLTGDAKRKYSLFAEYTKLRLTQAQLEAGLTKENEESQSTELFKIRLRINEIVNELNPDQQ